MSTHGMKARIARELGISGAAVSKLAAKGMPTSDADAARRWRAAHIDSARMRPDPGPSDDTLLQRAQSLAELGDAAIDRHALDAVAADVRAAMRAVPKTHRHRLTMSFALFRALIGPHAMAVLDAGPKLSPDEVAAEAALPLAEGEHSPGDICFALACGEAHVT